MMIQAVSRIQNMPFQEGLFTESLAAALSQTTRMPKRGYVPFWKNVPRNFDNIY